MKKYIIIKSCVTCMLIVCMLVAQMCISVFALPASSVQMLSTTFENVIESQKQYNIIFSGKLLKSSVSAECFYLDGTQLSQNDISVNVLPDAKTVVFELSSDVLVAVSECLLDIDGFKDESGKEITCRSLSARVYGDVDIDCNYYLLKGDTKLRFDGRVDGTVLGEAAITNNTTETVCLAMSLQVYNGKGFVAEKIGEYISVLPGETKKALANTEVNSQNTVYMAVIDKNERMYTEQIEITGTYTPKNKVLVEETLSDTLNDTSTGLPLMSGWLFNTEGGTLKKANQDYIQLIDNRTASAVSASKKFMAIQSGKVTLETALLGDDVINGFTLILGGYRRQYEASAVRLVFTKGFLNAYDSIDRKQICEFVPGNVYKLKITADLSSQKYDIMLDGVKVAADYGFFQQVDTLCNFEITTMELQELSPKMKYVDIYTGYDINERFLSVSDPVVPDDWNVSGSVKTVDTPSGNARDRISLKINDGSVSHNVVCDGGKEIRFSVFNNSESLHFLFGNIDMCFSDNKLSVNDKSVCDLVSNLWYDIRLVYDNDSKKAQIYVDGVQKTTVECNIAFDTQIEFSGKGGMLIDDIYVSDNYTDTYYDVQNNSDGYNVHMMSYPMWREGSHFGWDRIAPYRERIPYIGFYDDGNREAMDIQIKWLAEHNVDTLIFPFVRSDTNVDNPIKGYVRESALEDAYLNCAMQNKINFAIMMSAISTSNVSGSSDFRENIVPFLVEHYFKNPNYAKYENKPIVYLYTLSSLKDVFGSEEKVRAEMEYLNSYAQSRGFDGVYAIASCTSNSIADAKSAKACGIDSTYSYAMSTVAGFENLQERFNDISEKTAQKANMDYVSSAYMGYNTLPWRKNSNNYKNIISPCFFENVLRSIKRKINSGSTNIVTLGNWCEFGEGHYIMPSNIYGYKYLEAIKKVFSGADVTSTEKRPDATVKNKCGWMYVENENIKPLYIQKYDDIQNCKTVKEWEFNSLTSEISSRSNAKISVSGGVLNVKTADANDEAAPCIRINTSNEKIDSSKCKYLVVKMAGNYEESGALNCLMYISTDSIKNVRYSIPLYKNEGVYIVDLSNAQTPITGNIEEIIMWPSYFPNDSQRTVDVNINYISFMG